MKNIFFKYIILCLIISSCSPSDDNITSGDNFDRKLILENTYDNIIIPAFNDFDNKLQILESHIVNFTNDASQSNLEVLRISWENAYISWQSVAMFNIRKAEEIFFADIMNTYPCNENIIDNSIQDSIYEISSISINNLGSTGFPAIGYLIYGLGGDNTNVVSYYNSSDADKYKAYLTALINNMTYNTNQVINDWTNNRDVFVSSTGNTSTSSLNKVINDFLHYFEKRVREAKIATPSAIRGDLNPRPDQIESFYKPEINKILLENAFLSITRFYYGFSYSGLSNGTGLEDYLIALENTNDLRNAVDIQIDDINQKISLLDDNFILQLENDPQLMWDVFYSMQNLVTYTKSDMLSKFNISSYYMDNDGD
jgi:predicted lipoprotein